MRTSIINADKAKKYRIFYKIVAAAVKYKRNDIGKAIDEV